MKKKEIGTVTTIVTGMPDTGDTAAIITAATTETVTKTVAL